MTIRFETADSAAILTAVKYAIELLFGSEIHVGSKVLFRSSVSGTNNTHQQPTQLRASKARATITILSDLELSPFI